MTTSPVQRPTLVDHVRGELAAPAVVVLYGDFQCPYTRQAYRALQGVWRAGPDQVAWAFRHFPRPMHPQAWPSGRAAEAAAAQGQFWPMADLLFRHQQELSEDLYGSCAERLELDLPAFTRDRHGAASGERIAGDLRTGIEGGVTTIPTLFVDGNRHRGGYDIRSIRALLDARRLNVNRKEPAG